MYTWNYKTLTLLLTSFVLFDNFPKHPSLQFLQMSLQKDNNSPNFIGLLIRAK